MLLTFSHNHTLSVGEYQDTSHRQFIFHFHFMYSSDFAYLFIYLLFIAPEVSPM